ncbi:hypothetical protein L1887_34064 [Cichorium endivia]|nr:hypothetical protein L1887_34064 [Cichorium endivia]
MSRTVTSHLLPLFSPPVDSIYLISASFGPLSKQMTTSGGNSLFSSNQRFNKFNFELQLQHNNNTWNFLSLGSNHGSNLVSSSSGFFVCFACSCSSSANDLPHHSDRLSVLRRLLQQLVHKIQLFLTRCGCSCTM